MVLTEVRDYARQWPVLFDDGVQRRFSPAKLRLMADANGVTIRDICIAIFGERYWESPARRTQVMRWLKGQTAPKLRTTQRLAQAVGCDLLDLYEEVK